MLNLIGFKKHTIGKLLATSLLSANFVGLFATTSLADPTGSIVPDNFTTDAGAAQTITLDRTVHVNLESLVTTTTNTVTTIPEKVDILFLADNTGSMGQEIADVQTHAQSLLDNLRTQYSSTTDIQFGVARYYGAPKEYGSYKSGGYWVYDPASVPGRTYETTVEVVSKTFTSLNESGYLTSLNESSENRQGEPIYKYNLKKYGTEEVIKTVWNRRSDLDGETYYKYNMEKKDATGRVVDEKDVWSRNANLDGVTRFLNTVQELSTGQPIETLSYELQVPIGGTDAAITQAIGTTSSSDNSYSWHAEGGKDWPEANFFALHQAATSGAATNLGWQTGYDTNWRDDAMKIIVWFGDAYSHSSDTTQAEVITALTNNNIYVVAVNVGSGSNNLNKDSQATNITTATSGQYASSNDDNVASTMETLIGNAVDNYTVTTTTTTNPTVNLDFRSSGDTTGLTVTYTCTDDLGCDNVSNGEARTFQMTVVGDAGEYDFDTIAFDVDTNTDVTGAIADNLIILHVID